jgi:hypothetical protein
MAPKYKIAWNRRATKRLLAGVLKSDIHNPQRPFIQNWYDKYSKSRYLIMSLDGSKAERHLGGRRGEGIYAVIAGLTSASELEGLQNEFMTPLLTFGKRGAFTLDGGRILGSGLGTTTLHNCIGSDINFFSAMHLLTGDSYSKLFSDYKKGVDFSFLSFGDDVIAAFSPRLIDQYGGAEGFKKQLLAKYTSLKLSMDVEPVNKYLGHVYGPGTFKGSVTIGYPLSRAVQQHFFPEREKHFPFALIGYIARLYLLDKKGEFFHDVISRKFWNEERLGPKFAFRDRQKVLLATVPLIEKYADKIGELDDMMQGLYHGTADFDMPMGWEFDEFLGLSQVDVSDPNDNLEEQGLPKYILDMVRHMFAGDYSLYPDVLRQLSHHYKLQWKTGSMLY